MTNFVNFNKAIPSGQCLSDGNFAESTGQFGARQLTDNLFLDLDPNLSSRFQFNAWFIVEAIRVTQPTNLTYILKYGSTCSIQIKNESDHAAAPLVNRGKPSAYAGLKFPNPSIQVLNHCRYLYRKCW